jgi:hypothetical protein
MAKEKKKETLEEMTKEEFDLSLVSLIQEHKKIISNYNNLLDIAEFYEHRGYRIKYFYDPKENSYLIKKYKINIGYNR